jgi:hypothetical protein
MTIVTRSAAVVLLAAAAAIALGQAGGQPTAPAPGAEPPSAAARLAAAEKACMFLHDLADGSPIAHQTVEHSYLWSLRRFEAQRDVELAKDHGVAAARRHLDHVRALAAKVAGANAKGAFSTFDVAATEYYVAEAEELLAKARAK